MHTFIIDGIAMTAEKKRIKNMYLRVVPPDGMVKITAPMTVTVADMKAFAASRLGWIKAQRQKLAVRSNVQKPAYVTGELIELWGQRYRLEVRYGETDDSGIEGRSVVLTVRAHYDEGKRAGVLHAWYRKVLTDAISRLRTQCERTVGVVANEWKIRDMRTRWGTCSVQAKRIWLSLQLVKKPPECLEYVMIHELIHLLAKDHDEVFYAYLNRFRPGWREEKDKLNRPMIHGKRMN